MGALADLLRALRDLHPPDWRLDTLLGEAARRGWRSGVEVDDGETVRHLEVAGIRGVLREETDEQARAQGVEVAALRFTELDGRLQDAVDLLGAPPSVVDGPTLRWYADTVRVEVSGHPLTVRLEPMPWVEDEENRAFEWGGLDSAPYRWRAVRGELLPDRVYLSGAQVADDIGAVLGELPWLFRDLQRAAVTVPTLLGEPTWIIARVADPSAFVQGYFSSSVSAVERRSDGDCASEDSFAPTMQGADRVSSIVRSTLETWRVTDPGELTLTAFARGSDYWFNVLGLGVPVQP
ncbi:hypothetical protein [uncultured Jatrophihabitans sp.]|uniref:hypothetical protein n=1 Tax=uncultured Jatrophihabitans sp. TaxID=1610747 RepID=UPI0035CC46AA